jgi:hypothetical protein
MKAEDSVWNYAWLSIVDGQTHNKEDWKALGQSFGAIATQAVAIARLSSVSVCNLLLLCLSVVGGPLPRTNSQIKSIAIDKSAKVKRLIYWGLCPYVLNLSNHSQIVRACLNSRKSSSSKELIVLTCL